MSNPPLSLGQVLITPNIHTMIRGEDLMDALDRHVRSDWGEVNTDQWLANDIALDDGTRVISCYKSRNGIRFLIITSTDRSLTLVILPSEY